MEFSHHLPPPGVHNSRELESETQLGHEARLQLGQGCSGWHLTHGAKCWSQGDLSIPLVVLFSLVVYSVFLGFSSSSGLSSLRAAPESCFGTQRIEHTGVPDMPFAALLFFKEADFHFLS